MNQRQAMNVGGFPKDFTVQQVSVELAERIAKLSPAEIATYFRDNPSAAEILLTQSYDKRFTPSTFIEERGAGFRVGWFSSTPECVQEFHDLADAVTDYLLFSLGRGRWSPPANPDK